MKSAPLSNYLYSFLARLFILSIFFFKPLPYSGLPPIAMYETCWFPRDFRSLPWPGVACSGVSFIVEFQRLSPPDGSSAQPGVDPVYGFVHPPLFLQAGVLEQPQLLIIRS